MRRLWPVIAIALVGAAGLALYLRYDSAGEAPRYRLAKVETGTIQMAVSSTGKVTPVQTVEVGSQVSGQISELLADFNTAVKADQVIARIEPGPFEARLEVAKADLAVAKANVAIQRAATTELQAELAGSQAALTEMEADLARKQSLAPRGAVSASTLETAVAARDQARARLDAMRAQISKQQAQVESALAQVQSRQATLRERSLDLEHTVIRSPVQGVVIARSVDIGQTVAASLQAPVLFSIARDLASMQVEISVDEADIGRVADGQQIRFTVDAFPRREFVGTVTQIRKEPKEVSNVVSYTVIALADNPDLSLLPGMTANVTIVIGERHDVLKVPEAALRFVPDGAAAEDGAEGGGGADAARARAAAALKVLQEKLDLTPAQFEQVKAVFIATGQAIRSLRDGGQSEDQVSEATQQLRAQARRQIEAVLSEAQKPLYKQIVAEQQAGGRRRGRVWIVGEDGAPVAVKVTVGLSDDTSAELLRGDLKDGQEVIIGLAAPVSGR